MSFERRFRHFSGCSTAPARLSQKPSFLRGGIVKRLCGQFAKRDRFHAAYMLLLIKETRRTLRRAFLGKPYHRKFQFVAALWSVHAHACGNNDGC